MLSEKAGTLISLYGSSCWHQDKPAKDSDREQLEGYIASLEAENAALRERLAAYEVGFDPKITLPKDKEYVLVREVRGDQPIYWDVQYLGKDLWVNWAFNDPSKDADIKRWYPLPLPEAPEVEE